MKKSLVLGASTKPHRYSYKCIKMLRDHDIETVAIGIRSGKVADVEIMTEKIMMYDIHTVNIYLSPKNTREYEDFIIQMKPERVIFPPGTENLEFEKRLDKEGIFNERACPLVMLSINVY